MNFVASTMPRGIPGVYLAVYVIGLVVVLASMFHPFLDPAEVPWVPALHGVEGQVGRAGGQRDGESRAFRSKIEGEKTQKSHP